MMRRLTKFEKGIAKYLYDKSGQVPITFNGIYRTFASEFINDIVYRVRHPNDDFAFGEGSVEIFYRESLVMTKKETLIWEEKSRQLTQTNRRFFDTLNLISLLERNGLLYIAKSYYNDTSGYLPSGVNATLLSASSIGINRNTETLIFDLVGSKEIDDKGFQVLLSSTFQLTAAFEIFVENDFRTEEQVMNDEQKENNRISREINTKALEASNHNLKVAIAAVIVSALISTVSLGYSIWKDNTNSDTEKLKNDELVKNGNRMINAIEGIRSDIKQSRSNPFQIEKDSIN